MSMKRSLILALLLSIASIANAQPILPTTERQNFALATIAFGSVTASYTTFLANASGIAIKSLDISNRTDADITCSYNASTDHFVVFAYSWYSPPLAEINFHESSAISCKRTSGAPTVGSVYISAEY